MVQILRDQARQYASDQSGAIESMQEAEAFKNYFGTIGNVFGAGASLVQDSEKEEEKKAIEADQQMIDTQIGSKAQTELLKWNVQQIEAGVNPNSDEYTQKLYAWQLLKRT